MRKWLAVWNQFKDSNSFKDLNKEELVNNIKILSKAICDYEEYHKNLLETYTMKLFPNKVPEKKRKSEEELEQILVDSSAELVTQKQFITHHYSMLMNKYKEFNVKGRPWFGIEASLHDFLSNVNKTIEKIIDTYKIVKFDIYDIIASGNITKEAIPSDLEKISYK